MERCTAFFNKIKQAISGISLENLIVRLLTAWAATGVVQNIFVKQIRFTSDAFFEKYTFFPTMCIFVMIFSLLTLPAFTKHLKPLLWVSFFGLFLRTLWQRTEFGYYMGAVLVMALISAYALKDCTFKKDIRFRTCCIGVAPFAVLIVTVLCVVTILLYKAYWTPTYDFGIFSQMFYYMKETLRPLTTCERDGLLSHFAVHFSPVYYLILPVYFIFPSPITLLVMQALISVSGVIPVIALSKKYGHTNLTTMFLGLCYLGIPAITGGNFYYLHENVFLSPLLLWMFYFFEKKNIPLTFVFAALTMLVKEDAPVYVAVFGIYLILSKRNVKLGAWLTGGAVVYFVTVVGLLGAFGEGAMVGRFDNFNKSGEPTSLVGVIMTAFSNPAYVLSECFQNDRLLFLIQLFLPVMFLPFFTKKFSRLVLLAPVVIINLLSDYGYQHDMSYQYVFGSLAFVLYLTVMNSADLGKIKRTRILAVAAASSVMIFYSMYYSKLETVKSYKENMEEHKAVAQALEAVPDDASVSASTFLVANLSQRDEIYELETTKHKTEYYVVDFRYETEAYSLEDFTNGGYETIVLNEYVGVFKAVEESE